MTIEDYVAHVLEKKERKIESKFSIYIFIYLQMILKIYNFF